ncbi:hypothetical protein EDD11_010179 [Mortierella claussenii]|nr:hypothetical protein EDD11_010179 [Mortierella claussenii]
MPSVIHNHTQTSAPSSSPSGLEFVPDSSIYTNPSSSSPKPTVHDLKGSSRLQRLRQQWSDPDDEFSVPIHTEYPLITKNHPLDISSFLLNYRTMHRSIEIMTPPVVSQISNDEVISWMHACIFPHVSYGDSFPTLTVFGAFRTSPSLFTDAAK